MNCLSQKLNHYLVSIFSQKTFVRQKYKYSFPCLSPTHRIFFYQYICKVLEVNFFLEGNDGLNSFPVTDVIHIISYFYDVA